MRNENFEKGRERGTTQSTTNKYDHYQLISCFVSWCVCQLVALPVCISTHFVAGLVVVVILSVWLTKNHHVSYYLHAHNTSYSPLICVAHSAFVIPLFSVVAAAAVVVIVHFCLVFANQNKIPQPNTVRLHQWQ